MFKLCKRYFRVGLKRKKLVGLLLFLPLVILVLTLPRNLLSQIFIRTITFEDSDAYCNNPHVVHGDENKPLKGYTLQQVQILIRHGDRAPIELNMLPNLAPVHISCVNKSLEKSSYNAELEIYRKAVNSKNYVVKGSNKADLIDERKFCKGGQLTPYGFLQHIYLGKHIRRNYHQFISKVDLVSEIHVQSTDVPRTIQSSAALMTGIFRDEIFHDNKNFLIPINVYPDELENGHMLLDEKRNHLSCPVLAGKMKTLRITKDYLEFKNNIESMLQMFASVLGTSRESIPALNRVTDSLYTRLCHGQGIPSTSEVKIPYSLVKQAFQFSHLYNSLSHSSIAELQSLSLLSQIGQQVLSIFVQGSHVNKLVIYSGHDSMITPFLQMLNIYDGKWPPYASRVVIEIYKKDGHIGSIKDRIDSTYFRVLYNGKIGKNLKFCQNTAENGELCAVKDLYRYISDDSYNDASSSLDLHVFSKLLFTRIKNLC